MDVDERKKYNLLTERFKRAILEGDSLETERICKSHPDFVRKRFRFTSSGSGAEFSATALHLAVRRGRHCVGCCRVLLENDANIEATDAKGRTPLMLASDDEAIALLLSRAANVHAQGRSNEKETGPAEVRSKNVKRRTMASLAKQDKPCVARPFSS